MKKKITIGLGIPTLMMIFTVLCLAIFALFTYVKSSSNYQQALKYQQSNQEYLNTLSLVYESIDQLQQDHDLNKLEGSADIIVENENTKLIFSQNSHSFIEVTLDKDYNITNIVQTSEPLDEYGLQGFVY